MTFRWSRSSRNGVFLATSARSSDPLLDTDAPSRPRKRWQISADGRACSGALVEPALVLTAASCFPENPQGGVPAKATTVTSVYSSGTPLQSFNSTTLHHSLPPEATHAEPAPQ
ncbi:trypsin-like serine protease [Amycolatopsis sp. NPDC051128]|uniref:trypsin-like serine protease n=1 Tax=Amycolatopsis sp. NPDC051128 TaxID=3155412 RepID=UPI003431EA8F